MRMMARMVGMVRAGKANKRVMVMVEDGDGD